tara:strand:+ start:76 stop:816 length:741 start_codon:yes stop_codon:yes gene_type:complete
MSQYSQNFLFGATEICSSPDDRPCATWMSADPSLPEDWLESNRGKKHYAFESFVWNVPLHALPNFQGHGYLKGMNKAETKQFGRSEDLNELLFQIIAAHLGFKSANTFDGVDYTEAVKECKCIIYIPHHQHLYSDDEGIYELRRGDIISDFRYERQKSAKKNLKGITTFAFDIDRLLQMKWNFKTENINNFTTQQVTDKIRKQYITYFNKSIMSEMKEGKKYHERDYKKTYPVMKPKILKKKNKSN